MPPDGGKDPGVARRLFGFADPRWWPELTMKFIPIAVGGGLAGLMIVVGEAVLNLAILADDWAAVFARLALPRPTAAVAAQGVLKLLLLGPFSVWLAVALRHAFAGPDRAGIAAGLIVWLLVWAWVQWGMLLAGYVTPNIAVVTIAWGGIELPLAAWAGARISWRMANRKGWEEM